MVGIISRMEAGGFVTCCPDPNDRRNKLVLMTEKSIDVGSDIDNVIENGENEMMKSLTASERKELVRILEVILNNLK